MGQKVNEDSNQAEIPVPKVGNDMASGKFVVFEGIEGSGKSVQTKEFYNFLLGLGEDAIVTEQPWEGDAIGKLIREELVDKTDAISAVTLQFLFIANRSNHVEKLIEPNLKMGKTVIADRYWMSTVAYGSTLSKETGMDMDYFIKIHKVFPKPDIIFFIDVDPDTAYKRIIDRGNQRTITGGAKKERFDKLDTLELLRQNYMELKKRYDGLWIDIDGNKDKDAVTAEIKRDYNQIFKDR